MSGPAKIMSVEAPDKRQSMRASFQYTAVVLLGSGFGSGSSTLGLHPTTMRPHVRKKKTGAVITTRTSESSVSTPAQMSESDKQRNSSAKTNKKKPAKKDTPAKAKTTDAAPPWRNSEAKAHLKMLLENDTDGYWHSLAPRDLYKMSELFQKYPEDRFLCNLRSLKASTKSELQAVAADKRYFENDQKVYEPQEVDACGQKRWDRSAAKPLLHADVKNKIHVNQTPKKLWMSRTEYQEFDLNTFRGHIYQEEYAQSGRSYWQWVKEEKRKKNKDAMDLAEEFVAEMKSKRA